jgi:hypothetical protein
MHAGMTYVLVLDKGSLIACCPRCGLHFYLEHPGSVKTAFAHDFYSGTELPAIRATYVEGGNTQYCAQVEPIMRKEPQTTVELHFDRCLPTLVAFASEANARKYQAEHGGRLLSYAGALESVRER